MKMNQEGTTRGEKGESGERSPAGAKASDAGGEQKRALVNGVGQGQHDATGRSNGGKEAGEMNTGRKDATVYRHTKSEYRPGKY